MEVYERLERAIAQWSGVEHVVCCASGTAALHLALEALRLPPGSEVVTADFNMIAVPRAITMAGLVPVFVDCGEDLLIDPELLEDAVTERTRAIVAVHIYGRHLDMARVHQIADASRPASGRDLFVVEDLAEIHGVSPHPGTDAACWSFYRNKIVAGEEGGAVAFRDPAHAALARRLRSLGFTPDHDFRHVPRGHNYRLSNVHAGLILDSLRGVQANLRARRRIELAYLRHTPAEWLMPPRDRVWVYDIRVPGMTREKQGCVVRTLQAAGLAARHSFLPMHVQQEYAGCRRVGGEMAERMASEVFYLPATPGVTTEEDCRRAIEVVRAALMSGIIASA